jgi:hypothetical protein
MLPRCLGRSKSGRHRATGPHARLDFVPLALPVIEQPLPNVAHIGISFSVDQFDVGGASTIASYASYGKR